MIRLLKKLFYLVNLIVFVFLTGISLLISIPIVVLFCILCACTNYFDVELEKINRESN